MKTVERIKRCFSDPEYFSSVMLRLASPLILSDKLYLKLLFKNRVGYPLNLNNPQTFNEKIQWLKLYDRRPEYTIMVDKVKAKDYVAGIIGEKYIIPTLGVWDKPEDIDYDSLPEKFVIKCNHNSGTGTYICKDKSKLDIKTVNAGLRKGLKQNYYLNSREWPYKNVDRKVIAEKYIESPVAELLNYKFYCFNGEPKFLYVEQTVFNEKAKESYLTFYNLDWTKAPFYRKDHSELPFDASMPERKNEMIEIARKISTGIPFLRVDLYYIDGQIYFSENTFSPGGGFGLFYPEEWEMKMGKWIVLDEKKK